MGYTNSDLMEELMVLSYEEGIINEVRNEVKKMLEENSNLSMYEVYELAYNKISKEKNKK